MQGLGTLSDAGFQRGVKRPPPGLRNVPRHPGRWAYGKLPTHKIGQMARAFLKVRKARMVRYHAREPWVRGM